MAKHEKFTELKRIPLESLRLDASVISETMKAYPYLSEAGARAKVEEDAKKCEYWINSIYQVQVEKNEGNKTAWINIRRRDGRVIVRDWQHFQKIKNAVIGEECEAVELYPAESRKVDNAHRYHLYASIDPQYRFPFGMQHRDVAEGC
jgi:hypothetical protein